MFRHSIHGVCRHMIGFKINDSFEHERGLKVLNKIMCVDELNSLRSKLSGFLRFSFSTRTQFKELLSKSGFTVHDNPGTASLLLGRGSSKLTLGYELIDYCWFSDKLNNKGQFEA